MNEEKLENLADDHIKFRKEYKEIYLFICEKGTKRERLLGYQWLRKLTRINGYEWIKDNKDVLKANFELIVFMTRLKEAHKQSED